jgi:hypothetical protein
MTRLFRLLSVIALLVFTALALTDRPATAEPIVFQTDMFGAQQVPPVQTNAYGFVRFFFNDARTAADYTVDVKGLATGLVLGADIHRGSPGENGPVVKELATGGFIVAAGHMTLSSRDLQELEDGEWYVSLKTVDHPQGELRGQVVLPPRFQPTPIPPPPAPTVQPAPDVPPPPPDEAPEPPADSEPVEEPPRPTTPMPLPAGARVLPPNTGDGGLRD